MKKFIRSVSVLIIVALLFFGRVSFIRQAAFESLLWSSDEAYVFVNLTTFGYRVSYLQYLGEFIAEYFGAPRPADKRHYATITIHVTSGHVQRSESDGPDLRPFVPSGTNIYTSSGTALFRWSGNGFELVPVEQRAKIQALIAGTPREFVDVDGWSKKEGLSGLDGDMNYNIEIGKKPMNIVVRINRAAGALSIDLVSPDQSPQRIYFLDRRARHVSSAEYDRLFGDR